MSFHLLDYLYCFTKHNYNDYIILHREDVKNLLEEVDYFINKNLENLKEN